MAELYKQVKDKVDEVGWYVISVFPTEEDPITPFSYSVGFIEKGHPEVIIYGLPPTITHDLIGCIYDNITEKEKWYTDGDEGTEIVQDPYKVKFKQVPGDGRPAYIAKRLYGGSVPLLQMVWPDANHNFPWDEDWDDLDPQPVLADEPDHPDLQERD